MKAGLSKIEFKKLLSLATKETYFLFKGKLHKQAEGITMGSPLGLLLANAFLVHFEKKWLQNCPSDLKPYYYRRVLISSFYLPHQNI